MAFWLHIGAELSGKAESNRIVDKWLHMVALYRRLAIMERVMEL